MRRSEKLDGSPAPASIHFAIPTETSHCKQHPAENIRLHEHTGGLPLELEAFHCIRDVSGLLRVASLVLGESVPARPYDACPFGYMADLGLVHQDIDVETCLDTTLTGFNQQRRGPRPISPTLMSMPLRVLIHLATSLLHS